MTELVLLRHAEPMDSGTYLGRRSNPGLSDGGREVAKVHVATLADEEPAVLISSPQRRAMETIGPLAKILHQNIKEEPDLAEIDFGEWDGLSWKEIKAQDPETWKAWMDNPWEISPPGGETLRQLSHRVNRAIETILAEEGRILLCTHGGPIRAILCHALLMAPSAYWSLVIDYAGLCRFRRISSGPLELLQWNVALNETRSLINGGSYGTIE